MSKDKGFNRADPYRDHYQEKIEQTYKRCAVHIVIGIFVAISALLMMIDEQYALARVPDSNFAWVAGLGVGYALGAWVFALIRVMPLKQAIAERSM